MTVVVLVLVEPGLVAQEPIESKWAETAPEAGPMLAAPGWVGSGWTARGPIVEFAAGTGS
jgi:hypothetical protein